jgi:hypothetical protein
LKLKLDYPVTLDRSHFTLTCLLQNATAIASRFRDLYGLELAVKQVRSRVGPQAAGGEAAAVLARPCV